MGRVYCGPYAEQVGYEHEGYAFRVPPSGEPAASLSATGGFVAHVAACACGWAAVERHPATDEGEEAALEVWEREHLQPLIAAAAREGWAMFGRRTASAASEIAAYMGAGRVELAPPVMRRLVEDVTRWARVLDDLVEEQTVRGGGGR